MWLSKALVCQCYAPRDGVSNAEAECGRLALEGHDWPVTPREEGRTQQLKIAATKSASGSWTYGSQAGMDVAWRRRDGGMAGSRWAAREEVCAVELK